MNISEAIRKEEGLSKKEAARLEKLFDEVEAANPSMPPEIYQPDAVVEIDSGYGGQTLDGDLVDIPALQKLIKRLDACKSERGCAKVKEEIFAHIKDYVEFHQADQLDSISIKTGGWIAHLSMPGYLDQTEPSHYDTLKEAIEELHSMYVDNG